MVPSKNRFHGLASLRFVYNKGQTTRGQYFAIKSIVNKRRSVYRVAVVVSKKVSKLAVKRNRIRRRLYEAIRLQSKQISEPYDIVLMVYSDELVNISSKEIDAQVKKLLKTAKII